MAYESKAAACTAAENLLSQAQCSDDLIAAIAGKLVDPAVTVEDVNFLLSGPRAVKKLKAFAGGEAAGGEQAGGQDTGAPAGDETLAAVDRLSAGIEGMLQGFLSTIQPLLRTHIAASNCSSTKLSLLTDAFKISWDNTATPLADVLRYWPFEPPDHRSPGAPPTMERMMWGRVETDSMPQAISSMQEWVNDDELLVIDVSSNPRLSFRTALVEVTGSKTDIMGFHSKILNEMHPADLAVLKDGNPTRDLLLKLAFAIVFAYETKRTAALGTSGAWGCKTQTILQFILLNHISHAWICGSEIPVIGGDLWPANSILVQSFPEGDSYRLQVVQPSEGDGLDMQKFVVRAIQRRKQALWQQYQGAYGGNNNPNPSAGAGGNTSDHGDPAGNGGDRGSHSVPGSSHGGASLIHSGAAGGSHGASAGATGLVVSSRGLNAEYWDSLVGLEEEDLNTAAQNMLMRLFSDPRTMSSFGVAAPPTLEAISVVDVEEFLRKAGQAVARKVIQQRGMVIRDVSATVDQA